MIPAVCRAHRTSGVLNTADAGTNICARRAGRRQLVLTALVCAVVVARAGEDVRRYRFHGVVIDVRSNERLYADMGDTTQIDIGMKGKIIVGDIPYATVTVDMKKETNILVLTYQSRMTVETGMHVYIDEQKEVPPPPPATNVSGMSPISERSPTQDIAEASRSQPLGSSLPSVSNATESISMLPPTVSNEPDIILISKGPLTNGVGEERPIPAEVPVSQVASRAGIVAFVKWADLVQEWDKVRACIERASPRENITIVADDDPATLEKALCGARVLVVPEQERATRGSTVSYAFQARHILTNFVRSGGTVVSMAEDYNRGFLNNAGLLNCRGRAIRYVSCVVLADCKYTVGVSGKIEPSYVYPIILSDEEIKDEFNVQVLVKTDENEVAAVWKKLGKGNVIYLGWDFSEPQPAAERILQNIIAQGK